MRKISAVIRMLAFLLMAVILTGCHGSKDRVAFEVPESFDTTRDIEISFWAKNDTNIRQTKIYEKTIEDFERLYPNIHVNLRLYTDYGKIYNDVITNISTDTTPNVCITYPDHIATYITGADVVVPLDTLIADKEYGLGGSALKYDGPKQDEMIPEYMKECRIDDTTYALPYMRSTEACYINRTYLEAMGYELPETLTWDFVWEVSEAAMAQDADGNFLVNGQKVMIPFIYKSTDNMMIQYLAQADAGYSDPDGNIMIFNDVTKNFLLTVSKHAGTKAFSTFKISSYPGNFLNAGQCIFAIDSTAGATWMGSHAPLADIHTDKMVEFETEVMMIPQVDPEHPKMISQGPSLCLFNKEDPQEVLASWIFMQYLITNEVQIAYSQTEGYVPVTMKAQNDPVYQEYLAKAGTDDDEHYAIKIEAAKLLLAHTQDTFVTPVFNGSASLRDAAGQMIESVSKSARRRENVDDAYIESLYTDVAALYRLDQISSSGATHSKLPTASLLLLITIAGVWIILIARRLVLRSRKS